jgi:hypothetical protein
MLPRTLKAPVNIKSRLALASRVRGGSQILYHPRRASPLLAHFNYNMVRVLWFVVKFALILPLSTFCFFLTR